MIETILVPADTDRCTCSPGQVMARWGYAPFFKDVFCLHCEKRFQPKGDKNESN